MLYQFLLDDVARKQINPDQLKKMQKGEQVEYVEDRRGNTNIKNKIQLKRTLSTKTPQENTNHLQMQSAAHAMREAEEDTDLRSRLSPVKFGATIEREPLSATSTDSKRLTM